MSGRRPVSMTVNSRAVAREVEPRLLLSDFLRDDLDLRGTHVGCEHGVCGTCTILLDGLPARACLTLAVQAEGRRIETVESLAGPGGELHVLQQAFWESHGLQCGFCTPGVLMTLAYALREGLPLDSEEEIREILSGTLCRCTGYQNIVAAVRLAVERLREAEGAATAAD